MYLKIRLFILLAALISPIAAQVVPLPYQLVINPIFIQNGPGGNIAVQSNYASSLALYQEATQRVYAQAGIRIIWQTPSVVQSTTYYTVTNGTAVDNLAGPAAGMGGVFDNHTLNLWFTASNGGTLGISQQSFNVGQGGFQTTPVIRYGATVAESVFTSPYTSLTTLPHEIGHVLGLDHNVVNSGPTLSSTPLSGPNLMASGLIGATTLSAITTDGVTGFGILTANQIAMLRLSPIIQANGTANDTYDYSAIPEPSAYVLIFGVLSGLCVAVRGLRRNNSPACKVSDKS